MKTIGLIGGVSPQSTSHYYDLMVKDVAKRLGGLSSPDILIHSVDFAPIAKLQHDGDWDGVATCMCDSAKRLEAAGAEIIGIASNTMHDRADLVSEAISVPFVHIATPTAQQLVADGFKRVGLLGTAFTMERLFYVDELRKSGLEPIVPDVDITNLNAIIFEELCKGITTDQSRQTYVAAIQRLHQHGAEAVILGCTEIGMLISDDDSPIPTYDTTVLHAKALVDAALS